MQDRLANAASPPSFVIADRHRETGFRAVVDGGKVVMPCAACDGHTERYPYAFAPGDGVVSADTMAAAPGLATASPWWVETSEHARIATDAHVRPLVVEALLATPSRRSAAEPAVAHRDLATAGRARGVVGGDAARGARRGDLA